MKISVFISRGLDSISFAPDKRVPLFRNTAWIAGVFTLVTAAGMLFGQNNLRRDDPLKSNLLKDYKAQLRLDPANEKLKQSIRQLDLNLRRRYFGHVSQNHGGIYLLLTGSLVFLVSATQASRSKLHCPKPKTGEAEAAICQTAKASRRSVAVAGVIMGALLSVLGLSLNTNIPRNQATLENMAESSSDSIPEAVPTLEELKQNWPRFRGAQGAGITTFTNRPVFWDPNTGAGILWKTPVPARGFNSPIVWGDRIYFSGAVGSECQVFCLEGKSGQILWRRTVGKGRPVASNPEASQVDPLATATMATDGQRVFAFFGNGELCSLTLAGNLAWNKNLGPLINPYGHAASLEIWRNLVILQLDQGEPEQGKSKLYAFDGRTGQVVWQQARKVGSSWATPVVVEAGGRSQIITFA